MRGVARCVLATLPLVGACASRRPAIPQPVGIDAPSHLVPAANPKVAPPPATESQIALDIDELGKTRCLDAALTSPRFNFNSMAVRPEDNPELRSVADCVTTGPLAGAEILLIGHATETGGDDDYDMMLARARAEEVMRFLVAYGVPRAAIHVRATVDALPPATEPAFPGDETRGWEGRRVDIIVQR